MSRLGGMGFVPQPNLHYSTQVSIIQVDPTQVSIFQVSPTQVNPTKISFSSSIAAQQFLSIHNTTPTSIYDLNNTALILWNTYLQSTTPLNLNLIIKDLPTGQLAEAQVTQFDSNGTPQGGNLLIDIDGNGLGWFIDTTPWENSEFSQTLTDTAYRATSGRIAAGRYDPYTTILHEASHFLGFIAGHSNYGNRIQTQND